MSDPVFSLILIFFFGVALAAMRFFKTLESDFWAAARTPVLAGFFAGVLIRVANVSSELEVILIGVLLTVTALYVRLTGDESEATDGMLLGALSGAAAALPLVVDGDGSSSVVAECILSGAMAGFGVTFAAFHVAEKTRQIVLDGVTVAAAIGAAYLPRFAARLGATDREIATTAAIAVPAMVLATILRQYPDVRAELRHEASLGFIEDSDVRSTAHPLLRLGSGGWTDSGAHRVFVRIANRIALRKRQQRHRPEELARLYQLEIIKLRMQLQAMSRIDRAAMIRRQSRAGEVPSDTMRTSE